VTIRGRTPGPNTAAQLKSKIYSYLEPEALKENREHKRYGRDITGCWVARREYL